MANVTSLESLDIEKNNESYNIKYLLLLIRWHLSFRSVWNAVSISEGIIAKNTYFLIADRRRNVFFMSYFKSFLTQIRIYSKMPKIMRVAFGTPGMIKFIICKYTIKREIIQWGNMSHLFRAAKKTPQKCEPPQIYGWFIF